jgi:hypothetical protein
VFERRWFETVNTICQYYLLHFPDFFFLCVYHVSGVRALWLWLSFVSAIMHTKMACAGAKSLPIHLPLLRMSECEHAPQQSMHVRRQYILLSICTQNNTASFMAALLLVQMKLKNTKICVTYHAMHLLSCLLGQHGNNTVCTERQIGRCGY